MDRATDPHGAHSRPPETRPVWGHSGGLGGLVRSTHHVTRPLAPRPRSTSPGRLPPGRRKGKIRARYARFFFCRAVRGKGTTGREAPRLKEGREAMNDVRLDAQQVSARAELRARGDAAADRGKPKPRGGAAQSVCQSYLLRRGARRGRVARQRAGRACRLQEAPLAGRAAAVAPQTWAPAEAS